MTAPVATLEGVSRSFGDGDAAKEALRDATFTVPAGSVTGLLGPNGSGKSTAIRILLGLLRASSGRSTVFGEDSLHLSRAARQRVGYLSERPFPHGDLPVGILLRWVAAFFDRWNGARVDALAARMRIDMEKVPDRMSVGERRRAELFLALAPDPDFLVLDDPWLGLDAIVRREVLEVVLAAAREEGKTVLFTSHALSDVERIVDRVVLLREGRVRADSPLDDLKARTKRIAAALPAGLTADALVVPGEVSREVRGDTVTVVTEAWSPALDARLRERGIEVEVEDLNLESLFLALAGAPGATADEGERAGATA